MGFPVAYLQPDLAQITKLSALYQDITETKAALAGEEECRKHCEKERAEIMKAGPKELSEMMSSILPKSDLAVWDDVIGRELTNGFHKALEESADGYVRFSHDFEAVSFS